MKNLPKFLIFLLGFLVVLNGVLFGIYFSKTSGFKLTSFVSKESGPGSCLVLEEKYCQKGEPVYKDNKLIFVGLKVPQNTPIFSPFAGDFSNTPTFFVKKAEEYITYPGISIDGGDYIVDEQKIKRPTQSFSAVYYDSKFSQESRQFKVEKEVILGYVSEKKIEAYGDYNLLIGFSSLDQEKGMFSSDEEVLKKLFFL